MVNLHFYWSIHSLAKCTDQCDMTPSIVIYIRFRKSFSSSAFVLSHHYPISLLFSSTRMLTNGFFFSDEKKRKRSLSFRFNCCNFSSNCTSYWFLFYSHFQARWTTRSHLLPFLRFQLETRVTSAARCISSHPYATRQPICISLSPLTNLEKHESASLSHPQETILIHR